ncbi:LINE-1 retrotransposable element ORF1 protein [Dissostichus eleginoides]|uniref:LINE-1 retrotransposable element ORF1 protein n=1 Tax=Dissostichus eleginoides TaxID=100907 RepID=A0AAD9CKT2_DISEL|nr:LINE-1 retrotransposable element ORF1 protein [Dissostichus eleginoides]
MPGRPLKTGPQTPAASKTSTSQAKVSSAAASQNTEAMARMWKSSAPYMLCKATFQRNLTMRKSELQHQANRITEAEERIGKTEDDLNSMQSAIKKLQDKCATLEMKVEDQENRGRRNNLRLIGLPENAEGQDVCAFLEQWLPRALGTDTFSTLPVIERAHRIGRLIAGQDPKPREIISRPLSGDSPATETLRGSEKVATIHGAPLRDVYPAILVVTHNGHRHSFNTVPDAEKFVQKLQKDARPTPVPN